MDLKSKFNSLLVISYFSNITGNCPAEWADDKLRTLDGLGINCLLITGLSCHAGGYPWANNIKVFRVPSLSYRDFFVEWRELKENNLPLPAQAYLVLPFAVILGPIIDVIIKFLSSGGGEGGRWSWLLFALPCALICKALYKLDNIFCTGGPTSAHVTGALVKFFMGGSLYCEFQDPIVGAMMHRSDRVRSFTQIVERFLAYTATRLVYVTKAAEIQARERNPKFQDKIISLYPGAWDFNYSRCGVLDLSSEILLLHLGTLYGSRNLDLLFDAIDALKSDGILENQVIKVVNIGAVYCEQLTTYLSRDDFVLEEPVDRKSALMRACRADALLLIQHTDLRSKETIPYKTYDYLNLKIPIFGILNNPELEEIIRLSGGYCCSNSDIESVKNAIITLLEKNKSERYSDASILDISVQIKKVFM